MSRYVEDWRTPAPEQPPKLAGAYFLTAIKGTRVICLATVRLRDFAAWVTPDALRVARGRIGLGWGDNA